MVDDAVSPCTFGFSWLCGALAHSFFMGASFSPVIGQCMHGSFCYMGFKWISLEQINLSNRMPHDGGEQFVLVALRQHHRLVGGAVDMGNLPV